LLPITSRFLLEMFRPDNPCWKPMVMSFRRYCFGGGETGGLVS